MIHQKRTFEREVKMSFTARIVERRCQRRFLKKLKIEVEEKGLKLSVTEGGKEGV